MPRSSARSPIATSTGSPMLPSWPSRAPRGQRDPGPAVLEELSLEATRAISAAARHLDWPPGRSGPSSGCCMISTGRRRAGEPEWPCFGSSERALRADVVAPSGTNQSPWLGTSGSSSREAAPLQILSFRLVLDLPCMIEDVPCTAPNRVPSRPCTARALSSKCIAKHDALLCPRGPRSDARSDLGAVRALCFSHVIDDGVAVAPSTPWALSECGGRVLHYLIEEPPRRFQKPDEAVTLAAIQGLVVPGTLNVWCTEVRRSVPPASPDHLERSGFEARAHDTTVTLLVVHEKVECLLLSSAAPTPAGPVERRGEDPR